MIKLITDGAADITAEESKALGIEIIPIKVTFDGTEYENMPNAEFYRKLKASKKLPTTSLINEATYKEYIEKHLAHGDSVFVMCLSSGLSGSFGCLKAAAEEINSENVAICDSETVAFGYRILVMEAAKEIARGATLESLAATIETLKTKVRLFAVIDKVNYLIKGGRLSMAAGVAVTALNIKPVVTVKDKVVKVVDKALGFRHGMRRITKLIGNIDDSREISFGHTECRDKLDDFMALAKEKLGVTSENVCDIGPVVGTHVGQGCVGVAYFEK